MMGGWVSTLVRPPPTSGTQPPSSPNHFHLHIPMSPPFHSALSPHYSIITIHHTQHLSNSQLTFKPQEQCYVQPIVIGTPLPAFMFRFYCLRLLNKCLGVAKKKRPCPLYSPKISDLKARKSQDKFLQQAPSNHAKV